MTKRRRIKAGEKVAVVFTARERTLVLEHTFASPEVAEPLETARPTRGKYTVRYTLDDIDELLGHVAAEANHSKTKALQKELDALYEALQDKMESYDDGLWQQPAIQTRSTQGLTKQPRGGRLSLVKGAREP